MKKVNNYAQITTLEEQASRIFEKAKKRNMDVELLVEQYFNGLLNHAMAKRFVKDIKITEIPVAAYSYALSKVTDLYTQNLRYMFEGNMKDGYQKKELEHYV